MESMAHRDFWEEKNFENVLVRIKTGYSYEEINKAWIIGELAQKLSEMLNYKDTIFLDYDHFYVGHCEPDYFISYDDGLIIDNDNQPFEQTPSFKKRRLVIREVSSIFSPHITLKLLEYAINNISKIESTQESIIYKQNYCSWKINTIDTLLIKDIISDSLSNRSRNILSSKVVRPKYEDSEDDINYYFQNNKYHIYYTEYRTDLSLDSIELLEVENIYQFTNISFNENITFDTDTSFYFIQGTNNPHCSKRYLIENTNQHYKPFEIDKIGSNKITLSFQYFDLENIEHKDRTILYESDTDKLFQDLDKALHYSDKELIKQRTVLVTLVFILALTILFMLSILMKKSS